MHRSLILFAALLLSGPAQAAVITDTFSTGASVSDGQIFAYKINVYDVTADITLMHFEQFTASRENGDALVVFGLWAPVGGGSWDLIWQNDVGVPPGGHDWVESGPINQFMPSGSSFAVGIWIGDDRTTYAWDTDAPLETVSWGNLEGAMWEGENDAPNLPDPLQDDVDVFGYHQRVTVDDNIGPADQDGDGVPIPADCDDTNASVYPGAPEGCDGIDSDCDGATPPDELDGDGDGWMPCEGDCDDGDPNANPAVPEDCQNGVDDDCDGNSDANDPDCGGTPTPTPGDDDDSALPGDDDSPGEYPGPGSVDLAGTCGCDLVAPVTHALPLALVALFGLFALRNRRF